MTWSGNDEITRIGVHAINFGRPGTFVLEDDSFLEELIESVDTGAPSLHRSNGVSHSAMFSFISEFLTSCDRNQLVAEITDELSKAGIDCHRARDAAFRDASHRITCRAIGKHMVAYAYSAGYVPIVNKKLAADERIAVSHEGLETPRMDSDFFYLDTNIAIQYQAAAEFDALGAVEAVVSVAVAAVFVAVAAYQQGQTPGVASAKLAADQAVLPIEPSDIRTMAAQLLRVMTVPSEVVAA